MSLQIEDTLLALTQATSPWANRTLSQLIGGDESPPEPNSDGSPMLEPAAAGPEADREATRSAEPLSPDSSDGRPDAFGRKEVSAGTCLALMSGEDPSPAIGSLTWLARDKWAKVRNQMLEFPTTARSLDRIESSIFTLVLSPESPEPGSLEAMRVIAHGTGRDRWGDKALTLVVCANGVAGLAGNALAYDYQQLHALATQVWHASNNDESVAADRAERIERRERCCGALQGRSVRGFGLVVRPPKCISLGIWRRWLRCFPNGPCLGIESSSDRRFC